MDEMSTTQGMGRRICKDGTEMDHLTRFHHYLVENHGVRGRIKTARNRRVRRADRQAIRNSQEG
jgi:hypothetical protein